MQAFNAAERIDSSLHLLELNEVYARLSRALARWPGTVHVGHYGAVRGLDAMKNVDAMATLGDPWPHLGIVEHDVAFLGLAEPWKCRLEGLCRAELEQAHGRLRVVHRMRPARALHVGNVLPGGSGWCEGRVAYRQIVGGRPRNEAAMTRDDARAAVDALGGIRAAARRLGCGRSTVCRYVNGEKAVPSALAAELRRIACVLPMAGEVAAE